MKKILFSLIALMCSMSMNAQVMKVMKGSEVVDTYKGADYKVVFEEEPSYLLPGSFSVSKDKKVNFTKSNLYWDGSAWKFEAKPTDYPTTREATHVGHFFWTKTAAASYAASYDDGTNATTDKFFADGSDAAHTLTVEGVSGLYILSAGEWDYLLRDRKRAYSLCKYGVTVNNISGCLVIAPDDYPGTLKATYTLEELETAGLICLPLAGDWNGYSLTDYSIGGYYWSSSPNAGSANDAQFLELSAALSRMDNDGRKMGCSLRAVVAEKPTATTTGTAKRTGNIDVKWVQLWENGPKFAEYNVGVTDGKAESYGGYYCWGSSIDKDTEGAYNDGTDALTGTDDTATNLWGSAWRMPTQAELEALENCDVEWTAVNGVNGRKFTGKGDYASNSVFLPAAGHCYLGDVGGQGNNGYYWSSTPIESEYACYLVFKSNRQLVSDDNRISGYSVRAVLAE